jgi:hypothetical protein
VPWLSNGSASYFVAGRTELRTIEKTYLAALVKRRSPLGAIVAMRKRCENVVDTR